MTIALVLLALPTPRGVSLEGHRVLAIVVTAVLLWATEVVPLAVSSLLVLVLLMISGAVKTPAEALSGFASTVLFFLLGSLTLGAAVVRSGLAERLADAFLRRARGSPLRLTVHLLVALPVFALVMPSAISRNALLVPAYESVFRSLGVDKGHRLAKVVMLTLGLLNPFASSALMTGGVAAMTAASLLGGFTWLGWFALMALPCHALLMLGGALLYLVHRPRHLEGGTAAPQRAARRPLTRDEKVTLVVVVGTTLLWLTDFVHHWSPAVPALGAAVILMIPRIGVLTWADLEKTVSWSTFLATGASLSLAQVLISTGGAAWFARSLLGAISSGPASPVQCVLCVIAVTTVVHLAVPSMSACIALLIPVVTAFAEVAGMNRTPWIRQGSRMVRRDR